MIQWSLTPGPPRPGQGLEKGSRGEKWGAMAWNWGSSWALALVGRKGKFDEQTAFLCSEF